MNSFHDSQSCKKCWTQLSLKPMNQLEHLLGGRGGDCFLGSQMVGVVVREGPTGRNKVAPRAGMREEGGVPRYINKLDISH